jgi:hypothetical protein
LALTTYYKAIIKSGVCSLVESDVVTVLVNSTDTWTGSSIIDGTSWADATNWSCGVPTSSTNVTINSGTPHQPKISSTAVANSITLNAGAILIVMNGNSLTVSDFVQNAGTLSVQNNANLIQTGAVDHNSGAGTTKVYRNSAALMRQDYTLWSSPVEGQQLRLFSPGTLTARFYHYNPTTDFYVLEPSTNNFAEGTGYLIRMPNNYPATPQIWNGVFTGTLHNGDVNLSVLYNTFNAIGNPYPSPMDADLFMMANNISGALYFWRKTNGASGTAYATYTFAGGTGTASASNSALVPNGIIQVGQGFIIKSTSTSVVFNNTMRVADDNDQFLRTSAVARHRIWLNLTGTNIFSQTMVAYMGNATAGVDAGIDGRFFNDSQTALTSVIASEEYAIQGRALPFDASDVVPLGFKSELAGTFTIALDHFDGLFALGQVVYLKDNLSNTVTDLSAGTYSFATEAGIYNNRFEIIYQPLLAVGQPTFSENSVVVYKQGDELVINTGKTIMTGVKVFDIRGRLLIEKKGVNAYQTRIDTGKTNQVLLVRISSKDGVVNKKVVN